MAKQFWCAECACRFGEGLHSLALVSVQEKDRRGEVVYLCRDCNGVMKIVDKPCEHEWGEPIRLSPNDRISPTQVFYWRRECKKCPQIQSGAERIVWTDA